MTNRNSKALQMRQRLAQEAAHIMMESGSRDFFAAKRKAAEHLAAVDTRNMPSNSEIEEALMTYQRIFRADSQPQVLRQLREVALDAMRFFAVFSPRLVGSVLRGTADTHSSVVLHLFAQAPEEVDLFLLQHTIPFKNGEKRLRYDSESIAVLPMFSFVAQDTPLEVVVFPIDGPHHPPLSPVDGRPMQRVDAAGLEKLLQTEQMLSASPTEAKP